ncbi:MAG: MATE family efflux transporter [Bacteroidaceae bacterium]|nr:MATE family efflux transporter [Bacteroidaceae bacterium]
MKSNDRYEMLTTGSVPKTISTLAVPTIISMLVTSLYSITDTYFVGQLDTQSTAAVGVVLSVMFFIQAVGFFFGHGSGNFISRQLGAKNREAASRMAATGFVYSILFASMLGIVGLLFLEPISLALGSTPTILPYTKRYLSIILCGGPFMAGQITLNNQMRLQGNASYAMVGIVSGAVLNVVLDPIFIFSFNMGVSGAALATVVSQMIAFTIQLIQTFRGGNLRIHLKEFNPSWSFVVEIISGGAPSLTRQALGSVSTIMLNYAAGTWGGDAGIAGMSIVNRMSFFINSVLIGYGQGFQPLCGFSYGAGLYDRVREGFWFCVKVGTVFLSVVAVFGLIFAEEIVALFRDDVEVITIGAAAFRWQLLTYPLGAIVMYSNMMMQTIRKPIEASILSSARQGIFFIPTILIIPQLFGIKGVEATQAIADLLSFLLAIPLCGNVLRKLENKKS